MEFKIVDNTLGEWLLKKESTISKEAVKWNQLLVDNALELSKVYVPILSGSLFESAFNHLILEDGFKYKNISSITWTGKDNPDESEFVKFHNYDYEDYALSNYLGNHYLTGTLQPQSHWWVHIEQELSISSISMDYLSWLQKR